MTFNPYQMFDVKGKVALIIGATGAFGSVASRTLAGAGCNLAITGGNKEALTEISKECVQIGSTTLSINERPENENNCKSILDKTIEKYKRIDILVVASGINKVSKIDEMSVDTFTSVMDINVTQSWMISREVTKQMKQQESGGKIVLVSIIA